MDDSRDKLVAWAAGFIDGEGCITIFRKKNQNVGQTALPFRYSLGLIATQKEREPLDRLVSLFDGSVRARSGNAFEWRCGSKAAGLALIEIFDYLTVKREQAKIALSFQSRRGKPTKGIKGMLPNLNIDQDEKDFWAIRELKGRLPR